MRDVIKNNESKTRSDFYLYVIKSINKMYFMISMMKKYLRIYHSYRVKPRIKRIEICSKNMFDTKHIFENIDAI